MTSPPRPPSLPSRYRTKRVLGRGGMGEVLLAHDDELDREVAIKLVLPAMRNQPNTMKRFRREAMVQAAVRHPNVVRLLECELEGDAAYLVMEYIEGRSLDEMIDDGFRADLAQAVALAADLGGGLTALHQLGALHRDLKPANVMVRDRDRAAVLMDLGLVKAPDTTRMTTEGVVVGTVLYLPPEVLLGEPLMPAGDQYQLAAVLFIAITGQNHFDRDIDATATVQRIMRGEWNTRRFAELPVALRPVLEQALSPEPADRYPDLAAFLDAVAATPRSPRSPARTTADIPGVDPAPGPAAARRTDRIAGGPPRRAAALVAAASCAGGLLVSLPWARARVARVGGGEAPQVNPESPPTLSGKAPDSPALDRAGRIRLQASEPAVYWWQAEPARRLYRPTGPAALPPFPGAAGRLAWTSPGGDGHLELTGAALSRRVYAELRSALAELEVSRPDDADPGEVGYLEAGRSAWTPALPWVPRMLSGWLPPPDRRRLFEDLQAWQRRMSAARVAGSPARSLAVPAGYAGWRHHRAGSPPHRSGGAVTGFWAGASPDAAPQATIKMAPAVYAPAFTLPHTARFRWPKTAPIGGLLEVECQVYSLYDAFLLRLRATGRPELPAIELFGAHPQAGGARGGASIGLKSGYADTDTEAQRHRIARVRLPAKLCPAPGDLVELSLHRLAGEYAPATRIQGIWVRAATPGEGLPKGPP